MCIRDSHYVKGPKTGKYYEIDWREADLAACIQDDFDGDGLAVVETYFANVAAVAAKKPTILGHFDLIKKVNGSGKFFDESDPRYTAAAHKLARILWAMVKHRRRYNPQTSRPFAKIFFRYSLCVRQTDWTVSGCESSCLIEASSLSANSSDRLVI